MSNFVIKNGVLEKCTGHAERVTIPEGVTTIGEKAFGKNPFIKFIKIVELPDSVTTIEACAFTGCPSLASVHIPESVITIGEYAFAGCSALSSISIPNSVTTLEKCVFAGCSALTSVDIPNSVTTIKYYAFAGCSALTSVNIPNSVTTIGDSAFYSCPALTSIYIPDSVTTIEKSAFADCSNLKEASLPETVKIEKNSFPEVTNITYRKKALIPNAEPVALVQEEIPFIPSNERFIIKNNWLIAYIGNEEHVIIPEGITEIAPSAFANREFLLSVDIPDSVVKIHDCAFLNCYRLEQISTPQNVRIGENVFYGCDGLYAITVRFPNGGVFDKSSIEMMFQKL